MAEGNIKIILVDPGPTTPDSSGGAERKQERRHEVWAQRRDISGFSFVESRAKTSNVEVVFRIKNFGTAGLRPTTDWYIIDSFDGDREYRIVRVHRVLLRGAARSTYFDLYGSYRGQHAPDGRG